MANTDGEINIKTKIDTNEVSKQIDGLKGKLTKITGSNVLKSITGLGAAFLTVKTAAAAANKIIKETSEAYRVQAKAEKQLEAAAKNNPYLDPQSVKQLKDYASQLQSIGTVGDEELIPFMAQLASAGRTQAEIQNIMSAALDVSASGMMSLDAAVTQLNASFSGNVGTLGRQISELKNLTAEELKNGAAVDIIKNKFAGMSKEVTEATGTSEQLKNAWGDLKEEIGAPFEKGLTPMRKFFTELINGWTDAAKKRREYEEASEKNKSGKGDSASLDTELKGKRAELAAARTSLQEINDLLNDQEKLNAKIAESRGYYSKATAENERIAQQKRIFALTSEVDALEAQLKAQKALEKAQKDSNAAAAEKAAKEKEQADRNKAALDFMAANEKALNTEIEKIKLEAKLKGEEADEQEILNAYIQSYIELVTGSDLVTENNPYSKKRLEELQNYAKGIQNLNIDTSELVETIKEFLGAGEDNTKLSEVIDTTITQLAQQRYALEETSEAWQKYTDKITELEALKTEVVKKEEETQKQKAIDTAAAIVDSVSNYIGQFTDIVNQVTQIAAKNSEMETQSALTELSDQYNDGLISYEEYCDKKGEINKKAALEEYKVNMWAWTASILTATANIASGVASCLAEPGIPTALKYVNMALVATSGAAQIASIVAAKPKRPSFYDGGFIGGMNGASYGADNTVINARRGELVVNARQQAQMWKMLNGGGGGGVSLNVDIVNNMGDSAKVTSQLTGNGLRVTVDKLVKAGLQDGRYNSSLDAAENYKTGVTLL